MGMNFKLFIANLPWLGNCISRCYRGFRLVADRMRCLTPGKPPHHYLSFMFQRKEQVFVNGTSDSHCSVLEYLVA
jgi:hypothetical protein